MTWVYFAFHSEPLLLSILHKTHREYHHVFHSPFPQLSWCNIVAAIFPKQNPNWIHISSKNSFKTHSNNVKPYHCAQIFFPCPNATKAFTFLSPHLLHFLTPIRDTFFFPQKSHGLYTHNTANYTIHYSIAEKYTYAYLFSAFIAFLHKKCKFFVWIRNKFGKTKHPRPDDVSLSCV